MLTVLAWIGIVVAILAMGVGVLATLMGLPGTIMVLTVSFILSASTGWDRPAWWVVLIFLGLTIIAETADNLLAAWGTRRYGGSTRGTLWALAGGVCGALAGGYISPIFAIGGPVAAVLAIGLVPLSLALVGGYLGAYWFERRQGKSAAEAKRAGLGGLLGRVAGALTKAVLASVMTGMTLWLLFRDGGPFG